MRYLAEFFRYRDLLFWLTIKEIRVRYKSPLLGVLWAFLVPLCLSATLWIIFTRIIPVPMGKQPFFLFVILGIFPWNFFAQSVSTGTTSVLEAGALIKKTAFPKALIPLSVVAANFFNFLIALVVVIGFVAISSLAVSRWVWLLPVACLLGFVLTAGVVFFTAGLQVRYRDIKYLVEIGLLVGFYLTPIFYPLGLIAKAPPLLQSLYLLNPLVSLVELFRATLLGSTSGGILGSVWSVLGTATALSAAVFVVGLLVFRRRESGFADWVLG